MRVLATADMHGFLPEIPDCDLLLIGGDICPDFPSAGRNRSYATQVGCGTAQQRQRGWLDTEFRAWLEGLAARGIQVVGIAGNHDFVFEKTSLVPDLPWIYLRDTEVTVGGLRIYGTPWVPNLERWAFYGSEAALTARAEAVPEGLDVLITHGPPFGTADEVSRAGHVGDLPLHNRLSTMQAPPEVIVTGHIHEGFGVYDDAYESSTLYSVSYVDEVYAPIRVPVTIWEFRS